MTGFSFSRSGHFISWLMHCSSAFVVGCIFAGCAVIGKSSNDYRSPITPIYYKLSKDGVPLGYLFGTVHLGIGLDELPNSVKKALNDADHFVAEIDASAIKGKSLKDTLFLSFDASKVKPGMSQLDSTTQEGLRSYFKDSISRASSPGIDLTFVEKLDLQGLLWFTNVLYQANGLAELTERLGTNPGNKALDSDLITLAKRSGKPTTFLDAKMLEVIRQCTEQKEDASIQFLTKIATEKHPEFEFADTVLEILDAYKAGQQNFSKFYEAENPQQRCLIDKRNILWKTSIVGALRAYQNSFIAVGRLHLDAGPNSLVNLLQADGYSLTPKRFE